MSNDTGLLGDIVAPVLSCLKGLKNGSSVGIVLFGTI